MHVQNRQRIFPLVPNFTYKLELVSNILSMIFAFFVKRTAFVSNKYAIYHFPQELSKDLRLRI